MAEENPERRTVPGYPNLRIPTTAEAREMGKLGGTRSAASRKKRKTMAEALQEYLSSTIQPSHPKYAEIKRMLRTLGILGEGEDPDNQMLILAGQMQRAQKDPVAAAFVRDTIGEKPKDVIAATVDAPPVVIGIHDPAWIAAERAKQERMVAEMRRTAIEVVPTPAKDVGEESDAQEGAVEGAGHAGTEGGTLPAQDGAEQPEGSRAASDANGAQAVPQTQKAEQPAPPPPPKPQPPPSPPKPPKPIDPNVCLPSATPPM